MHSSINCLRLAGLLFLLFCFGFTTVGKTSAQNIRVDPEKMVAAHNSWRQEVGVKELKWSTSLEDKATSWANELKASNGCRMKHSGPGENLFWGSGHKTATKVGGGDWQWQSQVKEISEQQVVDSWGSEIEWYSYETNSCKAPTGESCGHYTQLVWSTTSALGCGVAICPDDSQIWVCNYEPPGNIVGQIPY